MGMYERLFRALNAAEVRYVVVGGLAVVLHGHPRMTADVDLAVDLEPAEARRAIRTLVGLGLRSSLPVDPEEFADPARRKEWSERRGMKVFNLVDPDDPLLSVDLFVDDPVPFEELWSRAVTIAVPAADVRVASIEDLVRMKREAGRPVDREDVEALEALGRSNDGRGPEPDDR